MPGATGKIPKNADNKNESSRARPPSPVYPALVAGVRWRRCRYQRQPTRAICAGSECRRRRRRRRHRRRVTAAWGIGGGGDGGGGGGGDGGGGGGDGDGDGDGGDSGRVVATAVTVVVVRQKMEVGDGQNTSAYPFGSNFREESQSDKASRRVASVAAGREKYRG
ncbi:hypothetical protein G5I_04567 [Acromyrmex echinatior]|uniref:Uncharacterized protein n=1 Tax=Acromyrmex echinatior TaxID=103372 RepID=F4WFZ6_ACREC|nr:hypothetical protein G5I_04567 [Acromyrmex echinatior]